MKKQTLKNLKLNKKTISILETNKLSGGFFSFPLCRAFRCTDIQSGCPRGN